MLTGAGVTLARLVDCSGARLWQTPQSAAANEVGIVFLFEITKKFKANSKRLQDNLNVQLFVVTDEARESR